MQAMIVMFIEEFTTPDTSREISQIAPLALAFVGDSIFDLYLRTRIVMKERVSPKKMHLHASHFAKAQSQAEIIRLLEEDLTEEEIAVVKRARNTKVNTIPKHAKLADYKMATAFEALIGWLYVSGQEKRMQDLIQKGLSLLTEYEKTGKSGEKDKGNREDGE